MSILIKDLPLAGYEISIMKDGERYRARVDGIWCEVEEIPTTEPDTDTISRQVAIDALRKMQTYKLFSGDDMLLIDQAGAQTELMMLPPAQPEQPEPKRGEWLERDVIDEPKGKHITQWQSARCSVCGRYHTTPYLYSFTHYNFCPNCGAEMEVTT